MILGQLTKLLLDAGLSEVEVRIYTELLKKPAQNVWELVKRTGIARNTAYCVFSRLQDLKLVEKNEDGIMALSLRSLIAELSIKELKLAKTAYKLKQIAPFLRAPKDSMEKFEIFYTPEQIAEAYLFMAETDYDVNFDFGDFENFINAIGPLELAFKFREKRAKHAKHHAICTTFGPKLAQFCDRQDVEKYKNKFDISKTLNFKDKWIIFSDRSDYVLFNDVSDPAYPCSTLVKSKTIADVQRVQFDNYSKMLA